VTDAAANWRARPPRAGEDGKKFKTRSGDVVRLVELLDEARTRWAAAAWRRRRCLPDCLSHLRCVLHGAGRGGWQRGSCEDDSLSDAV
jgi:hypothetical protein